MIWLILLAAAFYGAYLMGWIPVSVKRAATFVGSMGLGRNAAGASFTSCHGKISRILRFRESRSYSFHLTGHIQQGSVTAQILDSKKLPLLTLTENIPDGILAVEKNRRYYLVIRFENASGDYQLDWL